MTELESESRLLSLPPEIREYIYQLILHPAANKHRLSDEYYGYSFKPALVLFKLNRQIYYESRKVFRDLNRFVRIETPWAEALDHVALEGHVPIITGGSKADNFEGFVMKVSIFVPEHPYMGDYKERFIILAEDIDKFTKMWFYAGLTTPRMNPHLRLELQLRDPFTPEYEEKRMLKRHQQQLLLPFRMVKDLAGLVITGDLKPFPSVEDELRKLQKIPYDSPAHCLRETTRLKNEGNEALKAGNYHEALGLYNQAWEAMHIIIKGRQRHVHADAFFARELWEEPFVGKHAQRVRLVLRITLVANTCQVYLKLQDYQECMFWGMRTISMIRDNMAIPEGATPTADAEYIPNFLAADALGKIYFRTGLAYKNMDDKGEARRLLAVARRYLPSDKVVAAEVAACALRIG